MIDPQIIRDFLNTLTGNTVLIGDDDSLINTRVLDSLKLAELITFLESQYNFTFDGDDLTPDNLDSIAAMVRFLEKKGIN